MHVSSKSRFDPSGGSGFPLFPEEDPKSAKNAGHMEAGFLLLRLLFSSPRFIVCTIAS